MPKFKPNAYGEFVSQFRKIKAREENITYPSFEAAAEVASPLWEALSAEEKQRYKMIANRKKEGLRNGEDSNNSYSNSNNKKSNIKKSSKKTSQGKLLSDVHSEEQRIMSKILQKRRFIEELVRNADENDELAAQVFYVIHTTSYLEDDHDHYHAEIGISKFSLEKGVISSLHTFIDHDELPTGFVHEAKDRYEREHRIALPPYQNKVLRPLDYRSAYYEIKQFLTTNSEDGLYHLYTIEEQIKAVENFFQRASYDIGDPLMPEKYVVHDFMDLFFYIMKATFKNDRSDPIYKSFIRDIVSRDSHDMLKSLCCDYHYNVDALPCCSLSKAKRWAHYICEECCNMLSIYMVKGLHCPKEVNKHQKFPTNIEKLVNKTTPKPPELVKNQSGLCGAFNKVPRKPMIVARMSNPSSRPMRYPNMPSNSAAANVPSGENSRTSNRQGATAACMKLNRGGSQIPSRDCKSNSDEEFELPHNDINYAYIAKPWEVSLTARDIDPLQDEDSDELEDEIEKLKLDSYRELETRDRFVKRKGNIAANFDKKME